ncbi:hypothetical protein, partial [Streptomyces europaeiscabiei]|uniref:hypothetical protein n=1 Tax=Streptomyces europaeiscabiei TaxID=146819 RepID=UPI0038F80737
AAQVANNDTGHVPFNAARGRLEQFAVTAPSLAVPGDDDGIDHVDFRRHLATLGYRGWLVLKQGPTARPLDGIGRGMALLTGTYLRADRHGAGLL